MQELGERLRKEIRSIERQKRRDVRKMAHAKEDARLARVDATLARCEAIRASRAEMVARNLIAREMNRAKECIGLANIEADKAREEARVARGSGRTRQSGGCSLEGGPARYAGEG